MITTISKQRISDFQAEVNGNADKIRRAGQEAWKKVDLDPSEPKIIYDFLSSPGVGTNYLNATLPPLFGPRERVMKFASIFLHQKPMVLGWRRVFGQNGPKEQSLPSQCELGDLQFLFLYLAEDKTVCQCRSIIFQAKKHVSHGDYVIEHPCQRPLYDECTSFEYKTILSGNKRTLPSGTARERGLQYLFLEAPFVRARMIPADAGRGAFVDFGELLLRLMNDSTGLEVIRRPKGTGWDQIVWDLIDHVANTVTRNKQDRNNGIKSLFDHFNSFENHANAFLPVGAAGGSESGFGIQFVIVWDSQLGGEKPDSLSRGMPFALLDMVDEYLEIEDEHYETRIKHKDRVAEKMARLILDHKIPPQRVIQAAEHFRDEGLIVGAAFAMRLDPTHDLEPLLKIGSRVKRLHVQGGIVAAIRRVVHVGLRDKSTLLASEALIKSYLATADESLTRAIHALQEDLRKQLGGEGGSERANTR
jgi:hypothetical protein